VSHRTKIASRSRRPRTNNNIMQCELRCCDMMRAAKPRSLWLMAMS
jgi:hypothetical protein